MLAYLDANQKPIAVQIPIAEFEQIEEILENYGLVQLIEEVENDETLANEEALKYLELLKKNNKEVGGEDVIETVYGLGYRLREISTVKNQETVANNVSKKPQQISSELIPFWERSYQQYSFSFCRRIRMQKLSIECLQLVEMTM